jgi:hypothetical protein
MAEGEGDLTHLYVISEGREGPIKIGRSKSPPARVDSLQTGNPRSLMLVFWWKLDDDDAREAEHTLHDELKEFRLCGEWFDLSENFISAYMPDFFGSIGIEPR